MKAWAVGAPLAPALRILAPRARFALIFGETELASGCVALKPLRAGKTEAAAEQTLHPLADATAWAPVLLA